MLAFSVFRPAPAPYLMAIEKVFFANYYCHPNHIFRSHCCHPNHNFDFRNQCAGVTSFSLYCYLNQIFVIGSGFLKSIQAWHYCHLNHVFDLYMSSIQNSIFGMYYCHLNHIFELSKKIYDIFAFLCTQLKCHHLNRIWDPNCCRSNHLFAGGYCHLNHKVEGVPCSLKLDYPFGYLIWGKQPFFQWFLLSSEPHFQPKKGVVP